MAVLPDAWYLVLNALIGAPVAWRSPAEIADALAKCEGETTDLLSELDEAGWLAVWETEAGPLVTLSALAAERLGVRLVEDGRGQCPRSARRGDPDPPPIRSSHVCQSGRAASLDFVSDPAAAPDLAAERGERVDTLSRALNHPPRPAGLREDAPRPTRFVGLSLTPWPGPRIDFVTVCPACGNQALSPHMYCLYCDRWGLDGVAPVAEVTPALVRPATARTVEERATADALQAERLRARRKSKRRRRHDAKLVDKSRPVLPPSEPPGPAPFVPLHSPPPGKKSERAAR